MDLRDYFLAGFVLTTMVLLNIPSAEGGRCLVVQGGVATVNFTCEGGCCIDSSGWNCCNGEEGVGFGMGNSGNQNVEKTTRTIRKTTTSGGETVQHRTLCPILLLGLSSTLLLYLR